MLRHAHRLAAFGALCAIAWAGPASEARSAHFDVYSQAGEASARSLLLGFERLYVFFQQQTGIAMSSRPPVKVIVFQTRQDYEPYELRPSADAYYAGSGNRNYIVMTDPGDGDLHIAAHEYTHFMLHANAIELPPWLNEGLSEYLSNVRAPERAASTAAPAAHLRVLRSHAWMPLDDLMKLTADSPLREQRDSSELFYAQSWALADMLMASPDYSSRFPAVVAALTGGEPAARALARVFDKPLEEITKDLHAWLEKRKIVPAPVPSLSAGDMVAVVSDVSSLSWRSQLAELLLAIGKLDRAQTAYRELATEAPQIPDFPAALALISLQKGDSNAAREQWKRALDQGIRDAGICYRFAVLADAAGVPAEDIRAALERAVAVQPDLDDAHFMAAHLDNNAGLYQTAVDHLRAMRSVASTRQFSYWSATAYALNELGRHDEAVEAAASAAKYAATPEERARAAQLAEIAQTELMVRVARDANGNPRLVTTRVPRDYADFNPFIEPGDRIHRVDGKLRAIECGNGPARVQVDTAAGLLTVTIMDPQRVQMRNAPTEFTCGPQPATTVTVVYAESEHGGTVRGMEFH